MSFLLLSAGIIDHEAHTVLGMDTDASITWSNLLLVVVTIMATGITIYMTVRDSHKHENQAVDKVQDAAELSEERLAAIAMAAIDKYEHSDHSANPAAIPPSITESPKDLA